MYFCPARRARRAQPRAAFGFGLNCFANASYSGADSASFSITHSCRPMVLYTPQWTNIPNRASCHHFMRAARAAADCGADCASAAGRSPAFSIIAALPAENNFNASRRDNGFMI